MKNLHVVYTYSNYINGDLTTNDVVIKLHMETSIPEIKKMISEEIGVDDRCRITILNIIDLDMVLGGLKKKGTRASVNTTV